MPAVRHGQVITPVLGTSMLALALGGCGERPSSALALQMIYLPSEGYQLYGPGTLASPLVNTFALKANGIDAQGLALGGKSVIVFHIDPACTPPRLTWGDPLPISPGGQEEFPQCIEPGGGAVFSTQISSNSPRHWIRSDGRLEEITPDNQSDVFLNSAAARISVDYLDSQENVYYAVKLRGGDEEWWVGRSKLAKVAAPPVAICKGQCFGSGGFRKFILTGNMVVLAINPQAYSWEPVHDLQWAADRLPQVLNSPPTELKELVITEKVAAARSKDEIIFFGRSGPTETIQFIDPGERTPAGLPRSTADKLRMTVDPFFFVTEGKRQGNDKCTGRSKAVPLSPEAIGVIDTDYYRLLLITAVQANTNTREW